MKSKVRTTLNYEGCPHLFKSAKVEFNGGEALVSWRDTEAWLGS